MNKEECVLFFEKLNSMKDKQYIENFLIYNTALVIAGIKPASTVTIIKTNNDLYSMWIKYGRKFIRNIYLDFIELRESKEAIIILVFCKELLQSHINTKENKKFLMDLGYSKERDIDDLLNELKIRYSLSHYPHELGVFLGIPLNDVKDFIECKEKRCLLCGYWKVYNDFHYAKEVFDKFDMVKEITMRNLIKGNNSEELVATIRNSINRGYN